MPSRDQKINHYNIIVGGSVTRARERKESDKHYAH